MARGGYVRPRLVRELDRVLHAKGGVLPIPRIKAYWVMMTPRIAPVALRFGADDIDGTVVEEKIYHDAGATTTQSLRRGELLALIRKAGREPMERDTLYRPVSRTESTFTVPV